MYELKIIEDRELDLGGHRYLYSAVIKTPCLKYQSTMCYSWWDAVLLALRDEVLLEELGSRPVSVRFEYFDA
jgi:hypothetical protein